MIPKAARRMDGIEKTLIRQVFDSAPAGAINLGLGQPDLPTPARIALAGIRGIAEGRTAYTSTAGDPELRAAVARSYAPFAEGPESVLITVGSQEAVFVALLTLLDPGDEVLVPDPGYPVYPVAARLVGATPVPYTLRFDRGFRIDPGEIESRLSPRSRLLILCSPSNPTGVVEADDNLARLAEVLMRRRVAWLSDEIYAGFSYEGPAPSLRHHAPAGGIVVSGLSKDLSMTGWRIGWIVGPPGIVARLIAAHQYLVTCSSSVSQRAALAAMDPEARAEREAYLAIFRRRRDLMARELGRIPRVRFHPPGGAFYFFVDVSAHGGSLEIARRILERRRVVTIPGEAFGQGGEGFLRISYAAPEASIVEGIGAMAEELSGAR